MRDNRYKLYMIYAGKLYDTDNTSVIVLTLSKHKPSKKEMLAITRMMMEGKLPKLDRTVGVAVLD